jgi:hypothetical protein
VVAVTVQAMLPGTIGQSGWLYCPAPIETSGTIFLAGEVAICDIACCTTDLFRRQWSAAPMRHTARCTACEVGRIGK